MNYLKQELHLYIINVENESERRSSASKEAERLGLPFSIVRAVTPNEIPDIDSQLVSLGVRAVWLSHMRAHAEFIETGAAYGIIAEDDFRIMNKDSVENLIQIGIDANLDYLQIGFLLPGLDTRLNVGLTNLQTIGFKLLSKLSSMPLIGRLIRSERLRIREARGLSTRIISANSQPGAHFYLVSRRFSQEIQELNDPQYLSIDDFFSSLARMRAFRMARSMRNLVRQKNFPSWTGDRFKQI